MEIVLKITAAGNNLPLKVRAILGHTMLKKEHICITYTALTCYYNGRICRAYSHGNINEHH